ncbi:dipeptidyl aminopeptidase/acylaminoacyl peptidase [Legionella moravica]|uniref:Dipeptidyl aminopeptidase/acylaminoacyl peptidase n=1 Tax=Legionella moravica TaxID=39962 RepID=A0A378K242_9GAMM|nr:prolyl oligopeptidase family serine peptidase [Legionella moravica]KTD35257.1 dipeptidyl aminopeptidase/acylaminoacyl peptidase [Legionella moravica]STX61931.1 dipeptidyl aminopeptidase/acylaminoacyl peptidase [Legionella moravica]
MNEISRGAIRVKGFQDAEMDFQLIRQLGASTYRASSVGECLTIAHQIPDGTPEDWVKEFERLAEWQKKDGMERLVKNHIISGREQLFKASNSYRAAEYYSPCSSEHHRRLGLNSADCFCTAISNMDLHFENHSIPYKGINLPAYFISPDNDGVKRHTLMIVSGFDGTLEEEFLMRGLAAVERGYNVIHFAGPGQMDVFRKYPATFFEPDYEQVVKRVIDYFESRHEINRNTLALMGISFGGYFATRAASHEPRIKALIANSPILDLHAYMCSFVTMDPCKMPDSDDFGIDDLQAIPNEVMPQQLKAQSEQLIRRFGQKTFKQTFDYLKQFTVGDSLTQLSIPCLALLGKSEGNEPERQFKEFCALTEAAQHVFSDFEGAGGHCQVGNISYANAVVYDWLDDFV